MALSLQFKVTNWWPTKSLIINVYGISTNTLIHPINLWLLLQKIGVLSTFLSLKLYKHLSVLIIRIECTQLLSAVILNIVNSQIPNIPTIYKFQVYLSADRVFTKFIVYHYQKLCIIPNDSSTTGKLNSETQTHMTLIMQLILHWATVQNEGSITWNMLPPYINYNN